jgi:hypothetical protein
VFGAAFSLSVLGVIAMVGDEDERFGRAKGASLRQIDRIDKRIHP